MASLEKRFRAIQRENPYHSSLINFYRAIQGQHLSTRRLAFYFDKLVETCDYANEDKKEVRKLYTSQNAMQESRLLDDLVSKKGGKMPALI